MVQLTGLCSKEGPLVHELAGGRSLSARARSISVYSLSSFADSAASSVVTAMEAWLNAAISALVSLTSRGLAGRLKVMSEK